MCSNLGTDDMQCVTGFAKAHSTWSAAMSWLTLLPSFHMLYRCLNS